MHIMVVLDIMLLIFMLYHLDLEHLIILNNLQMNHMDWGYWYFQIQFIHMLVQILKTELEIWMDLNINIFIKDKKVFTNLGILDCLILENLKFYDFQFQMHGGGLKNIKLMDFDMMLLLVCYISIMELELVLLEILMIILAIILTLMLQ